MKPTQEEIKRFFYVAFPYKKIEDHEIDHNLVYFEEWVDRFNSPVRVWSCSDIERRRALIKCFPETFKGLTVDVNLNNPEHVEKYQRW